MIGKKLLAACLATACLITSAVPVYASSTDVSSSEEASETEESLTTGDLSDEAIKLNGLLSGVSLIMSNSIESAEETLMAQKEAEAAAKAAVADLGVAVVDDALNMREEPNTDSKVVGILNKNAVCNIMGHQDDWYYVASGTIIGWVKMEYIDRGDVDLLHSVATQVAECRTMTLKVRQEPSTESTILALVGDGDQLDVIDDSDPDWVKVAFDDGDAYVAREYIAIVDTYEHAVKPKPKYTVGQQVINYACQFVGNPYVWGGTSLTKGADCSGFIMSVYANFGVSLPHSSYALRSVGYGVNYADAKPGDIICYNGHCALYMGNGQIVHAASRKSGIKYGYAEYRKILAVRRIF